MWWLVDETSGEVSCSVVASRLATSVHLDEDRNPSVSDVVCELQFFGHVELPVLLESGG